MQKLAFITGGSRGIGKATVELFAREGFRVVFSYREQKKEADRLLTTLPGTGHLAIQGDVADPEDCRRMAEQALRLTGRIDVLVNNAGIYLPHLITQCSFDDWQEAWKQSLSVNLTGPANLCYLVAHQMIRQQEGVIVNVSSRGAFRGEPENPAYGASKAGLNAMSQSLAVALAPFNIRVGVVAPGFVETDMSQTILESPAGESIKKQSPFGRVASPEEVAYAILVFADKRAGFMSGAIIDVNGASYLRS